MRNIKVGLIQQANTSDIRTNLMNLAQSIEACAARGAQLVVLQELHNSLYFCQTENTNLFDLAEPIPGPSTGFIPNWLPVTRLCWLPLCLRNVLRDCITTLRLFLTVMAVLPENIARCIFLMILLIMRNSISLREILALSLFRHL